MPISEYVNAAGFKEYLRNRYLADQVCVQAMTVALPVLRNAGRRAVGDRSGGRSSHHGDGTRRADESSDREKAAMAEIVINGKTYEHLFVRGEVVGADKQLETKVSGGGGGGSSFRGTGYTAPVHISSTTTTHDMIHLVEEGGQEHAIRLQDWDLAVRQSHQLTAIWLAKQGKTNGPYVAIHNHTLNSTEYNEKHLAKLHRSLWILLASLAVLLVPVSGGLRMILMLAGLGYWWYRGIAGRRRLIASGTLLRLAGVQA
jgi:hypothetical protein